MFKKWTSEYNYQPLAFELNAFCAGTPAAFPQYVLLDLSKQIAQIAQRLYLSKCQCDCHSSKPHMSKTCWCNCTSTHIITMELRR